MPSRPWPNAGRPVEPVKVGRSLKYKPDANRSLACWLPPSGDTLWIYQKIATAVAMLNATHYRFDISGLDEPLYHVTYLSDDQGHYNWHIIIGTSIVATKPRRRANCRSRFR